MVEIIDFSTWNVYDGASEGSGRSEKIWLKSDDGSIGLFKFPKINPSVNKETTEHISEHLAHKIGNIIGVPTAKVDIGKYNGRIGCMSYFVCEENEFLREGIWFFSKKYPKYDADRMIDKETGKYYCVEHLFDTVPDILSNRLLIEMMLFDFLIGNSDRHQSNWALLLKLVPEEHLSLRIRWCPLYDNGSSLCSYLIDEEIPGLIGKDKNRFEATVDSKSRSIIRIDGTKKSLPTHREVIRFLLKKYDVTKEIAMGFVNKLLPEKITEVLEEYPEELLSNVKKEMICRFLNRKCQILSELLKEVDKSVEDE